MKKAIVAIGGALLIATLAGCTASGERGDQLGAGDIEELATAAQENGRELQADILADGEVSSEEYRSAYDALRECVEKGGYTVSDPIVNPLTNTGLLFSYNSNGLDQDQAITDYESCESEYWSDVALVFETNEPQQLDSQLAQAIVACLERGGYEVSLPDDETLRLRDIADQLETSAHPDLGQCASDETYRLYPEIVSVNVAF